jgi:desulfoferrodoxin-like iron-binding protein
MTAENLLIYHCQHCGKLVEQPPGFAAPVCCGRPMAIGAVETPAESRPPPAMEPARRRTENQQEFGG